MKQKLTTSGCAALRRQLCSPSNFIDPDSEIVEKLTQAKAAYFWEGTAMELPGARRLIQYGIRALRPEPGWEEQAAAMLAIADQEGGAALSLEMVDDLTSQVMDSLKCPAFTFGTSFADLGIGALRLVLATGEAPVRAPEALTRLTLGTLTLLVGGTRLEREELLGDFQTGAEFARALADAFLDNDPAAFRAQWLEAPCLSISELQTIDGKPAACEELSDLLLSRYHSDLPSELGMQYIPEFLGKWFPLERMEEEVL